MPKKPVKIVGKELAYIFCRSVGPKGTSVSFYLNEDRNIVGVWTNENCPYSWEEGDCYHHDGVEVAKNGHNVTSLDKESIKRLAIAVGLLDE